MMTQDAYKTIRISDEAGATTFEDEIQTITVTDGSESDTFVLTYDGADTAALAWDISAADLKTAIDALLAALGADVVVTESGGVYTVTMSGGTLAGTNAFEFSSTPTGCTVAHATTRDGGRFKLIAGPRGENDPGVLGVVRSILIGAIPTTPGTIVLYDGIDASGEILASVYVSELTVVGGGYSIYPHLIGPLNYRFKNGLFIDIGALASFSFTLAYE